MDPICITNDNDIFVNWKLVREECSMSDQVLGEVINIGLKFTDNLFYIPRGETEGLNKECEKVIAFIQNLIPNFNNIDAPFEEICEKIFTDFHQETMELQLQKARDLIEYLKSKYTLQDRYKRLISSDVLFDEQKEKLLREVFQLKEFKSSSVYKLFNSHIKYFFQGFKGPEEKKAFKSECILTENEIDTEIKVLIALSKRKLENYFYSIGSRKFKMLSIRNIQINPFPKSLDFSSVYDGLFEDEDCSLKQVVTLDSQHYIALISLLKSRKSCMILITPKCATRIHPLIEDHRVVIVTGSLKNNFLLYSNAFNVLIKGFISNDKEFIQKNLIELGCKIKNVTSGGYLKSTKELFLINENRNMFYHSFTKTNRKVSHLMHYEYCKVESNGNYLFLYNNFETCLVNTTLSRIYTENRVYSNCFMLGERLFLVYFNGIEDIMINNKVISEEYLESEKTLGEFITNANHIITNNCQIAKSLFSNLLKSTRNT